MNHIFLVSLSWKVHMAKEKFNIQLEFNFQIPSSIYSFNLKQDRGRHILHPCINNWGVKINVFDVFVVQASRRVSMLDVKVSIFTVCWTYTERVLCWYVLGNMEHFISTLQSTEPHFWLVSCNKFLSSGHLPYTLQTPTKNTQKSSDPICILLCNFKELNFF